MADVSPPPLPGSESAWVTYARFVLIVLPAFLALSFASVFLFPKVLALWSDAGLEDSRIHWLVETTSFLIQAFAALLSVAGFAFLCLEFLGGGWRRFRSWTVLLVAALLNLAALSSLTMMSISACLAAPVIAFKAKPKEDR